MKISTVFLDRDGVLNVDDPTYVLSVFEIRMHTDVPDAIKQLSDAGIDIFVVSNQACVGKGLIKYEDAEEIFEHIVAHSESAGGKIKDWYFCPHRAEQRCPNRKPNPGMFMKAIREHGVNMKEAVYVGDSHSDALVAKFLNIPFFLVSQGWGPITREALARERIPFTYVSNLQDAVNRIIMLRDKD